MELGFKLRCWTTFRADTLTTKLYYLATVHTAGGSFWFSRKTNTKKCHINFIRAPCFLFGLGVQGEPSHLPVACTRTQANKHTTRASTRARSTNVTHNCISRPAAGEWRQSLKTMGTGLQPDTPEPGWAALPGPANLSCPFCPSPLPSSVPFSSIWAKRAISKYQINFWIV